MAGNEEKCPYCGQQITKKQFDEIEKRIRTDAQTEFNDKINDLKSTLEKKDQYIKEINHENSKRLESIMSENAHSINKITAENEKVIGELRNQRKEDRIQFDRLQNDFDKINDKLRKRQSELVGEVGEIELLETLQESFPQDTFVTQSRGTSEADIVQTVHHNNMPLDIRICYDNKQKTVVTKTHVDKAKKYQQIHNTRYALIVSSILPKNSIPNSLFGFKDGILLVHPKITTEIVKMIRLNLIEIHTKQNTQENRDSKEVNLYNFITGHEFALKIGNISNSYEKLDGLLKTEIASHNKNWKHRRQALDELLRAKIDIETDINVITDEPLKEIKTSTDDIPELEQ